MIVEGEQIDPSVGQPFGNLGFRVEIEGLVPQMEARVGGETRPQRLDGIEQRWAFSAPRRPGSHDQVTP